MTQTTITTYKLKNNLYAATRDGRLHKHSEIYGLTNTIVGQIAAVEGVQDVDLNGVESCEDYNPIRHTLPRDTYQLRVDTIRGEFTAEVCVMWGDSRRQDYFDYTVMFWQN